ncbi:MAG: phosphohistidine phosphatase SixA [Blastocatellia bacterium]|nr:phosphohistidine phosphatase SixA [Blastocatellia bacterium]
MDLYLLRHAIAHDLGADGSRTDFDRSLTREGKAKMRLAAEGMKRMELHFDLILTSPLVRARETAEIVAETFNCPERITICQNLRTGFEPQRFLADLSQSARLPAVLAVGHEPDLSELAARLIFGSERGGALTFKKGSLCCIWLPSVVPLFPGSLRWHLTPGQLRLMAERKD